MSDKLRLGQCVLLGSTPSCLATHGWMDDKFAKTFDGLWNLDHRPHDLFMLYHKQKVSNMILHFQIGGESKFLPEASVSEMHAIAKGQCCPESQCVKVRDKTEGCIALSSSMATLGSSCLRKLAVLSSFIAILLEYLRPCCMKFTFYFFAFLSQ